MEDIIIHDALSKEKTLSQTHKGREDIIFLEALFSNFS